ncbi:nitrogenase molybdenum-iron protein subunit beta [Draconibacterium sp. IB214405]|uniref:nitrogenase molybdenum-iron protein subunit beta n=1 Tax=Draconibacterium sp. IB214405 TaxID=3097352 RepID=UPI002A0C791A|nr:nitrogenase molybdenum-iron protein subunit beta [Draconibacterium sp. IB214405]MDX8341307.1 nitrogenase molybdenum-iron protein subunit beta [Draconibacterium sp. IB214405]
MLLRHTTKEVKERKALTVNPAKTCQPVGAMYAALGVHGCLPHSHGSQGCCSYHRSALTRHYKEPVMAATSSFTEGSSVFGGQANLLQAIDNIFGIYEPQIIAVHSTCLSETIGDDLGQIVGKAKDDGRIPEGKHVVQASTPSYVGSHVTGYANMLEAFVKYFAFKTDEKLRQVNLLSGWVEPSDMRELKRLAGLMDVQTVLLPDTSDVVDTPMTGKYQMYPKGGTTIDEMVSMGNSMSTVALGEWGAKSAAIALDNKCKVPFSMNDVPVGISATDRFIQALSTAGKVSIPEIISEERGRLVDMMTDMHQYFYGKRVALFGDPDTLLPLTEFLLDLDMKPVYIVSGTPGKRFTQRMEEILGDKVSETKFKNGPNADMFLLHQWIKEEPVDLLIGNTYGKYIARDENIPFVRMGFPIIDRVGHSYFPTVGYQGGLRILEKILGAIMDKIDATAPEESFELVM